MAHSPYARLEGERVAITHLTGPFRKCVACGGQVATLTLHAPGRHMARLVCAECEGHTAFLSRDHLAAMLAQKRGVA